MMKKGSDPTHDVRHVKRLTKMAKDLVKAEKLEARVNMEMLMLAIVWHDSWTAKNVPKNFFQMLWQYIYEGWGSARIFIREAKREGLEERKIKKIAYAIRKHPSSCWRGPKSLEGKILRDVDNIDQWKWKRIAGLVKEMAKDGIDKEEKKRMRLAKIYFEKVMKKRLVKDIFFEWSKKKFVREKETYLKKVEGLMEKYEQLIK